MRRAQRFQKIGPRKDPSECGDEQVGASDLQVQEGPSLCSGPSPSAVMSQRVGQVEGWVGSDGGQ